MTPRKLLASVLPASMLLIPLACLAQVTTQIQMKPPAPAPKQGRPAMDHGERAFNANCFRCHQAPETLKPRIAGTVIRHMRVRANLSAQDERDILRFLNP